MAGAPVPAAGDIGLDTVTNAAQETNLENLAEAARRMLGVGTTSEQVYTISSGVVSPSLGMVNVETEGGVGSDFLDFIATAEYLEGSLILVRAAVTSHTVVVRAVGGAGSVTLSQGTQFSLDSVTKAILLRLKGTVWVEVARFYGGDLTAARSDLGLGSAALLDDGTLDAATLGGVAPSGYLASGAKAADSELLDGIDSTAFIRGDVASEQTVLGAFTTDGAQARINTGSVGGAPLLAFSNLDIQRTQVFYDGVNGWTIWRVLDADETTVLGAIRLRPNQVPEYWYGGQWVELFNLATLGSPGPWLERIRWDKLDGVTQYTASGAHVLQSVTAPDLPGSGDPRVYRVNAGIQGEQVGGSSPTFTARIYAGPTGDATDTLVYESGSVTPITPTPGDATISLDLEIPDSLAPYLTLVLWKTNSFNVNINPSVQNTYYREHKTYLRVEQIG